MANEQHPDAYQIGRRLAYLAMAEECIEELTKVEPEEEEEPVRRRKSSNSKPSVQVIKKDKPPTLIEKIHDAAYGFDSNGLLFCSTLLTAIVDKATKK